jgi:pimeloyl-ACP methyl ester carboxylesterase
MRRGPKIAIGIAVALAVLLAVNTVVTNQETKSAAVTVEEGEILKLAGGDVQILDVGSRSAPPVVLLHCYTCAIDWWEEMIPLLERRHRVIAIDLLGHGGSDKPRSGYAIEEQGALVAEALSRLGIRRAAVVGHSLGGSVATALAEQSPELVSGVVIVDQAPDDSYGEVGFLAKLGYVPVLGQAIWRVVPDVAVREGLSEAFAPDFDVPDEFVEDYRRMTFSSYNESGEDEYSDERPLDERLEAVGVPLLVIFGSEDQIYDARGALRAYAELPDARTELIWGAGHSPNVEEPARTARLVIEFARSLPWGAASVRDGG